MMFFLRFAFIMANEWLQSYSADSTAPANDSRSGSFKHSFLMNSSGLATSSILYSWVMTMSHSYLLNAGDYEISNETDDGSNLAIGNDLGSLGCSHVASDLLSLIGTE